MSLVNLTDITPPQRFDGVAWTSVEISEAPAVAGPWTVIDTQSAAITGEDPTEPQPRNLSSLQATITDGWYRYRWLDPSSGSSDPSLAWQNVSDQGSQLKPSVSELGAFMRARTVQAGSGGTEAGTFNVNTRPTAAEAQTEIDNAEGMVLMQVGTAIPPRLYNQARLVVKFYAAMLVEIGFYRNEINRDQSTFAEYQAMFKDALTALKVAIENAGAASPTPSFGSVPIVNAAQARFHALASAYDVNGNFDPSLLPPDYWYPVGPGGVPANLDLFPFAGGGLAEFEAPG